MLFFKQVYVKRKLSSWGAVASLTHSYIHMFFDIYNCRVGLGIKSDFRFEVFIYTKPCSGKYLHKLPPPPRHPPEPQEYIYKFLYI